MAVYRQVQTTYWQDDFVLKLTPEKKFFYIYLLTNSKTTQCGIYELSPKLIAFDTGYDIETIEKLLKEFHDLGKIKYNKESGEIAILNWRKYNETPSPKLQACVRKELLKVKSYDLLEFMGYDFPDDSTPSKGTFRVSDKLRETIFERDEYKCKKCGSTENLTIDHIYPRTLGGGSNEGNLRTLCRSCNSKRPLFGEELKREITDSGYDFNLFENQYKTPTNRVLVGICNKNKNKNKNKNNSEEVIMIGERGIIIKEYFVDLLPVTLTQQEIEAWVGWVDYRKEVKKKLTKRSAEMQIQFLLKQPDLVKCIGQSIQNQWQGLFEVKDGITKRSNKEITPERIASDLSKAF